jgi:hypothetical protein
MVKIGVCAAFENGYNVADASWAVLPACSLDFSLPHCDTDCRHAFGR